MWKHQAKSSKIVRDTRPGVPLGRQVLASWEPRPLSGEKRQAGMLAFGPLRALSSEVRLRRCGVCLANTWSEAAHACHVDRYQLQLRW